MQINFNSLQAKAICTYLTNKAVLQSFVSFNYEGMHLKMAKNPHFLSLKLKIDLWIHKNQT